MLVVPGKIRNIDISLRYFFDDKEVSYETVNKLHCTKSLTINLLKRKMRDKYIAVGVSNGPIQFESTRKIWPLLELLAKIR